MLRKCLSFKRVGLGLALLSIAGLFGSYAHAQTVSSPNMFRPHSLLSASPAEVGAYAVDYTSAHYPPLSGVPQPILVRSVAAAALPAIGLAKIGFAGEEPPLTLAIVHGDFDLRSGVRTRLDPATWHWRVGYIAYVFDLDAGVPTLMQTSQNGGDFRQALNDPNLPDDIPVVPPGFAHRQAVPMPAMAPPSSHDPYGSLAPPVAPRHP
jgi:hypothetical protein